MSEAAVLHRWHDSLSARTIIALCAGIAVGLFFGEGAALLQPVGDVYIRLVQMTVLPYLVFTLIVSLGELDAAQARRLAIKGALLLGVIILLTLVVLGFMPLAFPHLETASFFSHAQVEAREPFGLVETYVPANPFNALANSVVPAVVVFSSAVGVALIGLPDKEKLLAPMRTFSAAVVRVTGFVIRLTPLGVFAIAAVTAGTMDFATFARLQAYLVTFGLAALLLSFVILPLAVTAVTPLRYREVVGIAKDALLTAFVAQSVFIVLPILIERCKALMARHGVDSPDAVTSIGVLLPVAFIVPNAGKLMTLLFVPYVAWLGGAPLEPGDYGTLFSAGVPAYFAKAQVALPYLLDLLALPQTYFQLYIPTAIVTGKFDSMASAMSLIATALLGAAAVAGTTRIDPWRIALRGAAMAGALALTVVGARLLLDNMIDTTYRKGEQLHAMHLQRGVIMPVLLSELPPPAPVRPRHAIEAIRERGALRVGFVDDRLPFSFINAQGEPVGMDVELASKLAFDLGASRVELVPLRRETMSSALEEGRIDVLMSMPYLRDQFAHLRFSQPYFDAFIGVAVRSVDRHAFAKVETIRKRRSLRVGVFADGPAIERRLKEALPEVAIEVVARGSPKEFFEGKRPDIDAFVMFAESASAWTLLYPKFVSVVPQPMPLSLPVGVATRRGEAEFADYIEAWLVMQNASGATRNAYAYWVLGQGVEEQRRRWSVLRDVLGVGATTGRSH